MATIGRDTTITWLGHGTFHLDTPGGAKLLIDPWIDSNPARPEEWKTRVRRKGSTRSLSPMVILIISPSC